MKVLLFCWVLSGGWELDKLAVQHRDRMKPLDTFARELLREWTGKESFAGFRDPETGQQVQVFSDDHPTLAILELVFRPQEALTKKLFRIQHPDLKKGLGFPLAREYFSYEEISEIDLGAMLAQVRRKLESEHGPLDRAVLDLNRVRRDFENVVTEVIPQIIPVEVGEDRTWIGLYYLGQYLKSDVSEDPLVKEIHSALSKLPRERLVEVQVSYDELKAAYLKVDRIKNYWRARFGTTVISPLPGRP
jgi:hypothetical protein